MGALQVHVHTHAFHSITLHHITYAKTSFSASIFFTRCLELAQRCNLRPEAAFPILVRQRAGKDQIKSIDQACGASEQEISLTVGVRTSGHKLFKGHSPARLAHQGSSGITHLVVPTLAGAKATGGQVCAISAKELVADCAMGLHDVLASRVKPEEWQTAMLEESKVQSHIRKDVLSRGSEPGHEDTALEPGRNS